MNCKRWLTLTAVIWLAGSCSALAAERKHMVGFGLDSAIFDADNLPDTINFTGFSVFGKFGMTQNWGIFLSYRDMEDNEDLALGETDTYTQIGLYGLYMWRPDKVVRPHIKFGGSWVDVKAEAPGFPDMTDSKTGFSVGGGLEAGSPKVAFFGDWDFTVVTLLDEKTRLSDVTLGVVFRF